MNNRTSLRRWVRLLTSSSAEQRRPSGAADLSTDPGARYWWLLPGDAMCSVQGTVPCEDGSRGTGIGSVRRRVPAG
jgi:hypothetical protein